MKKIFAASLLIILSAVIFCSAKVNNPLRIIPLNAKGEKSVNVLRRGENSIVLHSGFVILKKGESIGKHNTKSFEELLIVFSGKGKFEVEGKEPIFFKKNKAVYCPPFSEHNVTNIGEKDLKYVYIVANTQTIGEKKDIPDVI